MLDMKLKLGFWICEEKNESEGRIAPFPPEPMFDITWQSPYIFPNFSSANHKKKKQDQNKRQSKFKDKNKNTASETKQQPEKHKQEKADTCVWRKPQKLI